MENNFAVTSRESFFTRSIKKKWRNWGQCPHLMRPWKRCWIGSVADQSFKIYITDFELYQLWGGNACFGKFKMSVSLVYTSIYQITQQLFFIEGSLLQWTIWLRLMKLDKKTFLFWVILKQKPKDNTSNSWETFSTCWNISVLPIPLFVLKFSFRLQLDDTVIFILG